MTAVLALQLGSYASAALARADGERWALAEAWVRRRTDVAIPTGAIDLLLAEAGSPEVVRVVVGGLAAARPGDALRARLAGLRPRGGARPPAPTASNLRAALLAAGIRAAPERFDAAASAGGDPTEGVLTGLAFAGASGAPGQLGPELGDMPAYRALSNTGSRPTKLDDPVATALGVLLSGRAVAWAAGRAGFGGAPLGARVWLLPQRGDAPAGSPLPPALRAFRFEPLLPPDGLPALSAVDAVRAWRTRTQTAIILGQYALGA